VKVLPDDAVAGDSPQGEDETLDTADTGTVLALGDLRRCGERERTLLARHQRPAGEESDVEDPLSSTCLIPNL
jgi:hypothetical protein